MTKVAEEKARCERVAEYLKKMLPEGSTVYTVVTHTARSGMMRRIMPIVTLKGIPCNISSQVSDVLEWKWTDEGAVMVHGCGMNMAFHMVYSLAEALYGDGYKLKHQSL